MRVDAVSKRFVIEDLTDAQYRTLVDGLQGVLCVKVFEGLGGNKVSVTLDSSIGNHTAQSFYSLCMSILEGGPKKDHDAWVESYIELVPEASGPVIIHPSIMEDVKENYKLDDEDIYTLWTALIPHTGREHISLRLECGKIIEEGESYMVMRAGTVIETVLDDGSDPCEEGYDLHLDCPEHWLPPEKRTELSQLMACIRRGVGGGHVASNVGDDVNRHIDRVKSLLGIE